MNTFQEAIATYDEFKLLFEQQHYPVEKCTALMNKLKFALTQFGFPNPQLKAEDQKRPLLLARNILEYAALMSIVMKDVPAFERYFAQLKNHYNDYQKKFDLPPSEMQETILGLNLLRLLSKNKLAEFHTEVELLAPSLHDSLYIKYPLQLEQYMMEGSYNKVLQGTRNAPSNYYQFFMESLMDTVRNEMADCIAASYTTLSIAEAQRLLGFSDFAQLKEFAQAHQWHVSKVSGVEVFDFQKQEESKTEIPATRLMRQALVYAKELERIV